jgi:transcriptional regulator with PAS, ATPase and Fis domain
MSDRAARAAEDMIGDSAAFDAARSLIVRIARRDASVLIEGETGTGKEVAARAIHYGSARGDGPFVPINCGAIPDSLFEAELFGHARGAFTDAKHGSPGILALAEGGSLFLDEVDSLSAKAQVALLRFLQDGKFRRIGEGVQRQANVRVLAASNRSLADLVAGGLFRVDLYYRLNVMYVELPPLRERDTDVLALARHFVQALGLRHGTPALELDADSHAWLCAQPWPGNIRQLQNLIEREVLLAERGGALRLSVLEPPRACQGEAQRAQHALEWNYRKAKARMLDDFNRAFLLRLMRFSNGNVSEAARACGKERRDLGRLLRKYALDGGVQLSDDPGVWSESQ